MPITETVLIEFTSSTEGLQPAEDKLAALGKIDKEAAQAFKQTNAQLKQRTAELSNVGTSTAKAGQQTQKLKGNVLDIDKFIKNFTKNFQKGFQEGVIAELERAAKSSNAFAQKFKEGTTNAGKATESLKSQLRAVRTELELMEAAGETNTERYKQLTIQGGKLSDTIADVGKKIKGAGSDTRHLDGFLSLMNGVSGGVTAAQGALALFGDENEDLQEVLVRVNAAMAITQGLTAVMNTLQKDSAASLLFLNKQRKVQNAEAILENAIQTRGVVVKGAATLAQRALNAAMAANPVGLLVLGITALVTALTIFGKKEDETADKTKRLNDLLAEQERRSQQFADALNKTSGNRVRDLEVELANIKERGEGTERQYQIEIELIKERQRVSSAAFFEADKQGRAGEQRYSELANSVATLKEELAQLEDQTINLTDDDEIEKIGKLIEAKKSEFDFTLSQMQQQKKVLEDFYDTNFELNRKEGELNAFRRQQAIKSAIAQAEAEVSAHLEGTRERLAAELHAIEVKRQYEIQAADITRGEIKKINNVAFAESLKIQFAFDQQQLENAQAALSERANLENGETKRRLDLELTAIELQRQKELQEYVIMNGKVIQVKRLTEDQKSAIEDKFLKLRIDKTKQYNFAIAASELNTFISATNTRLSEVQRGTAEELRLKIQLVNETEALDTLNAKNTITNAKELEARIREIKAASTREILELQKQYLREQLDIDSQYYRDLTKLVNAQLRNQANDRRATTGQRIKANKQILENELDDLKLQQHEVRKEYAKGLIDKAEFDKKYNDLTAQRVEKEGELNNFQFDSFKERAEEAIAFVQEAQYILSGIFDVIAERENNRLQDQRNHITELREAGVITEKEEKRRLKILEAEEKRIKTAQAKRDKAIALFTAYINMALSIVKASPNIPLMAFAGAVGAAQVAMIAARPIPKFRHGKKDRYTGPAEVGEAGTELIEQNGKLFVAKKSTLVWLGPKDKVYNPAETQKMLNKPVPHIDKQLMQSQSAFDYKKLAAEMAVALVASNHADNTGKAVAKHVPVNITNITEKGIENMIKKGLDTIRYEDKRTRW